MLRKMLLLLSVLLLTACSTVLASEEQFYSIHYDENTPEALYGELEGQTKHPGVDITLTTDYPVRWGYRCLGYDGGEGLEGRIVYNNTSNNWNVGSTPKASTTSQFIVKPSLYRPGTENPTLSPYHENFLDDAPWDESAVWEENTRVYMYPDQSSEVLTCLPIKAILQTCVFDGSYYYIRYNRYEGFVSVDDVDFDRPGKHMYAEYLGTGKVVNCKQSVSLRPYPNAQYDAIMQVPLGASVEVSDYNRDFYECVYRGETGYILRDYISVG